MERIPLDPKLQAALEEEPDTLFLQPVDQFREVVEQRSAETPKLSAAVAAIDNRKIPGPAGQIPIRVFRPEGRGPFPLLVYLHGGGWVTGSLNTCDDVCRTLCHRSGCVVVSAGYRLAPEHKYPAAIDDCYAVLTSTAENAAMIDGDSQRLAIAGDSSGGNLAAAIALCVRDRGGPKLALQVLICPVTNYGFDTASYHKNADGYGLTRDAMIFFWKSYLVNSDQGDESYASSLRAVNLAGLPPALIITAQFDPLRDDGEAYAARLHRRAYPSGSRDTSTWLTVSSCGGQCSRRPIAHFRRSPTRSRKRSDGDTEAVAAIRRIPSPHRQ